MSLDTAGHEIETSQKMLKGNVEVRANAFQDAMKGYTHASDLDHSNAEAVLGLAGLHSLSGSTDAAWPNTKVVFSDFPEIPVSTLLSRQLFSPLPKRRRRIHR